MRYQLRIELAGSDPAIWRRLSVPSGIHLDVLHQFIQYAMGWDDDHLHEFSLADNPYRSDWEPIICEGSTQLGVAERDLRLDELINKTGATISYLYDFGDDWLHQLKLEEIVTVESDDGVGAVIDGEGACPPEDCGGIWGYQDLLHASRLPRDQLDEELAEQLNWYNLNARGFDVAIAAAGARRLGSLVS